MNNKNTIICLTELNNYGNVKAEDKFFFSSKIVIISISLSRYGFGKITAICWDSLFNYFHNL